MSEAIKTHKDLRVWQESLKLAKEIYTITNSFPKEETYGLVSQMRRAAVSVASNIAEGAARASNREFAQFLYIALGSLSELDTQWLLAKELEMTSSTPENSVDPIRKMLLGLIRSIKKSI
ncbi:MAG: four helix bundle protein [Desulfobacteraceae bacterium]|nr:four helix bundle protein [Desulfobacteraceae bacterium]MBU4001056.1 four helix bundle protein [Pseudomonadota bacterium]MBU4054465.1 four helix bundle protein [Pseudomonadota bacterium]